MCSEYFNLFPSKFMWRQRLLLLGPSINSLVNEADGTLMFLYAVDSIPRAKERGGQKTATELYEDIAILNTTHQISPSLFS